MDIKAFQGLVTANFKLNADKQAVLKAALENDGRISKAEAKDMGIPDAMIDDLDGIDGSQKNGFLDFEEMQKYDRMERMKLGIAQIQTSALSGEDEVGPVGEFYKFIPAGTFTMGDANFKDNQPKSVTLSEFYMAETEVTQAQYLKVVGHNPSLFQSVLPTWMPSFLNGDDRPVESVSWDDAVDYCKKLSLLAKDISAETKATIRGMAPAEYQKFSFQNRTLGLYRLPSEYEWERAARGGKDLEYATASGKLSKDEVVFGRYVPDYDNRFDSGKGLKAMPGTASVGSKKPNAFGLHDMTGNVWEWTGTLYSEQTESGINPSGTKDGQRRVLRGGSWAYKDVPTLRSAYRGRLSGLFDPDNYCNGFRVVRTK